MIFEESENVLLAGSFLIYEIYPSILLGCSWIPYLICCIKVLIVIKYLLAALSFSLVVDSFRIKNYNICFVPLTFGICETPKHIQPPFFAVGYLIMHAIQCSNSTHNIYNYNKLCMIKNYRYL